MNFLPFISTVFIIISAVLVAIGWRQIKKGEEEKHKKTMIAGAIFAVMFLIIYVSRTALLGNTSFGGPDHIKIYYTIFLVFHIMLSTTGAVLGVITIRWGLIGYNAKHKKIGPITAVIWLLSAITGVVVYLLLYVFYPGGDTTSLIKAIFGL
jgi:putative membrane protein